MFPEESTNNSGDKEQVIVSSATTEKLNFGSTTDCSGAAVADAPKLSQAIVNSATAEKSQAIVSSATAESATAEKSSLNFGAKEQAIVSSATSKKLSVNFLSTTDCSGAVADVSKLLQAIVSSATAEKSLLNFVSTTDCSGATVADVSKLSQAIVSSATAEKPLNFVSTTECSGVAVADVSKLSQDLIMNILSRVSMKDIAHVQCVCKLWRMYTLSPSFLGPCGGTPWYYWYNGGADIHRGCVFNPDTKRWHIFSLPQMSSQKHSQKHHVKYVASCKSFALFGKEGEESMFWICNAWKRSIIKLPLPPTADKDDMAVSLTVNERKHVIIMARFRAGSDISDISVFMYTSETEKWSSLLSFNQKGWVATKVSTISDGIFYVLMHQKHNRSKFLIVCCSLSPPKMHRLSVPMDLTWIQLVNCKDQLLLVGATRAKYPSNPSVPYGF